MATGAAAEPATALLLMGLANAINSTSSDLTTDPAPVPRTLWLQNLAIGIEIFAAVLSVTICLLRAYIRIVTRNLGWGMSTGIAATRLPLQLPLYTRINHL